MDFSDFRIFPENNLFRLFSGITTPISLNNIILMVLYQMDKPNRQTSNKELQ